MQIICAINTTLVKRHFVECTMFVCISKAERALRCFEENPCTADYGLATYVKWLNSAGFVDAATYICSHGDRQGMFAQC